MDGYEILLALLALSGMSVVITAIAMFIESKMPDRENNDYDDEDYQEEFLQKLQQDTNWW